MSAFGTAKFPTTSLRLGMPSAFQNAYSKLGDAPRFAPETVTGQPDISVGDDFQAQWHQQKKADAHHMSRAKVQSTVNMYNRANSAPNNSPGHQQPVLSQRVFANPSMASGDFISARQDYASAPFYFSDSHGASGGSHCMGGSNGRLVGGVLRSAQGQSYGMSLLQKRLQDFEAIAQKAEEFQNPGVPMVNGEEAEMGQLGADAVPLKNYSRRAQGVSSFAGELPLASQTLGTVANVELSQLLQNVLDSISDGEGDDKGVTRLTYSDSTRAFALMVRLATTGGAEDLSDVLEYLDGTSAEDGIIPKLRALTQRPITDEAKGNQEMFISLLEFWERVKVYLTKMVQTVGMPAKNRMAASQAYIKSLGFTKLFKGRLPEEFIERQDAQQAQDIKRGAHFPGAGPGAPRRPDGQGRPDGRGAGKPIRREDTQHGYVGPGGAEFSNDDRQRFAYASGEFPTGGRGVDEEVGTREGELGAEEYEASALTTNSSNDGPRLSSMMSPVTGEWDIRAPRAPIPIGNRRMPTFLTPDAVVPEDEDIAQRRGEQLREPQPRGATPAPDHLPAFLQSRSDLPNTISGLQEMARRVNQHYGNNLPDGKGAINVGAMSKVRSVKSNFTRRLGLPS